ncbi:MAG TPA: extracellular solute-binding protein [Microbacterium sp.]|nr:extracellular solute-binding protein [Microbacterium sp.]
MKIRMTIGVAATAVAALALAGCSGSTEPAADDGSVSGTLTGVYDSNYKEGMDQIIALFEEEYPDVTVDMDYQGGDMQALISTMLQSGTAPDIILSQPAGPVSGADINVITQGAQGRYLDLSEQEWTEKIPDAWLEGQMAYEGAVYGYPGAVQPLTAIYNQDTLDEHGLSIPTTLSEMLELCADASAAGIYAYAQGLGDVTAGGPQMLSYAQVSTLVYGPDPEFKEQLDAGTTTYQDSEWVTQFEIYQEMFDAGCFGEGALGLTRQQAAEAVASGQALGHIDVGGQKAIMEGIAPEARFTITGTPATENADDTFVTALPGYTVSVNAEADNERAALAFMEFLATPEASTIYANMFSAVPILPDPSFEAPEDLADFAELVAAGNYAKLANLGGNAVQVTLNESIQSMLLGNDTPESAAEKLQAAFENAK